MRGCGRLAGRGGQRIRGRHGPQGTPAQKQDPCATSRFSGVYAGGNVGAAAYTALRGDWNELYGDAEAYSANKIGASAGVQAGYDWQSCNKVFGIVADFNWADTATTARLNPNRSFATDQSFESNMHWFSTVRARAGLAVNDTLFYVTGGLAVANITSTVNAFLVGSRTNGKFAFHDTRWGLAGGVGAEFALWNNWSLNTELLYLQFQRETDTVRLPASTHTPGIESNDSAWIARIGLNYRPDNPRTSYASAAPASPGPCGPARFNGGYLGGTAGAMGMTSCGAMPTMAPCSAGIIRQPVMGSLAARRSDGTGRLATRSSGSSPIGIGPMSIQRYAFVPISCA